MEKLYNKTILVTGASRGIGRAIALYLAKNGANVVVNYLVSKREAESVVAEIKKEKGNAIAIQADVTKRDEVEKQVGEILQAFGTIDGIVNNAGSGINRKNFIDTDWKDFEKHFEVQIHGIYNTAKVVVPLMMANKSGSIINIASSSTINAPPPRLTSYITTKQAVLGLTRSLAIELGRYNIRVNAVSPGFVDTDLNKDLPRMVREMEVSKIPLGRITTPEDVAKAVLFFLSSDSEFITGINMPVCGGQIV